MRFQSTLTSLKARGRVKQDRGAASLIVVMVLFFVMALAAAYSSRSLVFEQRTSANQYRSTQALEAAEAGVEWAVSMLNGGRIGTDCRTASAAANDTSFRQRYLSVAANGTLTPILDPTQPTSLPTRDRALNAACVFNGTTWTCSCPKDTNPTVVTPAGDSVFPAFQVRMSIHDTNNPTLQVITQPGVVVVESNGCTRADPACLGFPGAPVELEGRATIYAMVALKPALPVQPAAALTVRDHVLGGTLLQLQLVNTDREAGGITVQAGGSIDAARLKLQSIPGSPGTALIANDRRLDATSPISIQRGVRRLVSDPPAPLNSPNRVFASVLGTTPLTYSLQPAALTISCPPGNCRQTLTDLVNANPGRIIWVEGDINLDSGGQIGNVPTPTDPPESTGPAMIVATGSLVKSTASPVVINGFVYTSQGAWTGNPDIQGAAFVENSLAATAGGTIVFNRDVVQHLLHRSGSFVRVPGGWRDFR